MSEDGMVQAVFPDQLLEIALASPPVAQIAAVIATCECDLFLVGGAVRDLLLGRAIVDVDLAVDGDPAALARRICPQASGQTRFGTVSVPRGSVRYDLVRTRREEYPVPGALPAVSPANIEDDLARRDFSVNAMAMGLAGSRLGEMITVAGAVEDLRAGRLAVLHDRSFVEDPTRLLRLARYTARLRFGMEPRTRRLAVEAIAAGALETVSGTRVGNELRLLAAEADPVAAFEAVRELGLPWRIDAGLARRALAVLPEGGRADRIVLACVLGGPCGPRVAAELDRLGAGAADRDAIVEGAVTAPDLARRLTEASSRSQIAAAVGAATVETVALAHGHGASAQALAWLRDVRHVELSISGADLVQRGIPEGPRVGRALRAAREALLDGRAPDRASQLQVALAAAG
jgi:tRNA nucleotidyltransferase (CCA-adding enzyme)